MQIRTLCQSSLVTCCGLLSVFSLWSTVQLHAQGSGVLYGGPQPAGYVPNQVDLWTVPSVIPGQGVGVHVSSPTPAYSVQFRREMVAGNGAATLLKTFSLTNGVDRRSQVTWDAKYGTARAPWPVTFTINTTGFAPGIYSLQGFDATGKAGGTTLFVVRTKSIDPSYPLYALSLLTYQAYNPWGGASAYSSTTGTRGAIISLQRPYANSRIASSHGWRGERAFIAWLAANVTRLQFTTDYDLSTAPVRDYASTLPVAQRRPRLLILGQHTEYVTKAFRDWADLHVLKAGDMNLINFGANALYWQIRLEPSPARTGPLDFVCYKDASDPVSSNPGTVATSTVKWRSSLLSRPESKLFGAQYFAMVKTPGPFVITSRMPAAFLTGTGWAPGTALTGAAGGEADSVDPSTRSSVIATAQLLTNANPPAPFVGTITYRRPTLTSRVVNIGSLEWVKGYSNNVSFGVSKASFLRFNANLLRWAGASVQ